MDDEQKKQLHDLQTRRTICTACIEIVKEVKMDDPRRKEAIARYTQQLATIDQKISELTGKPPDIVVGLKTAKLFPKVPK